jgi:hypothetical protein
MTKNKTIYVALRMTELQLSELDTIRQPEESRSATIRRLISDAWADAMMEQDKENGYPSISDRVNCL